MNDVITNSSLYKRVFTLYGEADMLAVSAIWLPMRANIVVASNDIRMKYLLSAKLLLFFVDTNRPVAV